MSREVRPRADGLRDEEGDVLYEYAVRCPRCAVTRWVTGGRHFLPPAEQVCTSCATSARTSSTADSNAQRHELRVFWTNCLILFLLGVGLCIGIPLERKIRAVWEDRKSEELERERLLRENIMRNMNAAFANEQAPDIFAIEKEAVEAALRGSEEHPYFLLQRHGALAQGVNKVAVLGVTSQLDDRHFLLPEELRAIHPQEVDALCWIMPRNSDDAPPSGLTPSHGSLAVLTDRRSGALLKINDFSRSRTGDASDNALNAWLTEITKAP